MRLILLTAAALAVAACANAPMVDPARSAEIKKFEPKTDVAQIYVCRSNGIRGKHIRPEIVLDGKQQTAISQGTFIYHEVSPGIHTLVARTLDHDSIMPFGIEAGEKKFFQTWISMESIPGQAIIEETNPTTGKDCVTHSELVVTGY